ncbi:hypothetical protein [Listeria newyorkensis]|uniref:hypothetical protein n=1 Tax=Listeria newyorkensis TaxID=1497681 RepID=UPI0010F74376|nr:hypothetical protein [Listeria newyorkensis]
MKKWLIIFIVMILALSPLASNTAMAEDEVTKPAVRTSEERIQSPLGEELLDSPEGQFGKKLLKSQSTTHEKMKSPAVVTESLGGSEGELIISWPKATDAIGYKVGIFNGNTYDFIDVGSALSWSTKGKNIWPTKSELSNGKYNIHTDGLGSELPLDPSSTYKTAYAVTKKTDYSTRLTYFVRVMAIYEDGEGPVSDIVAPMMPFDGIYYTDVQTKLNDANAGATTLFWEAVEDAVGYKVWVFDGKLYHPYDVGNSYSWSTESKGIWPTKIEISQGKKGLHQDGKGENLSVVPNNVYQVNNPGFPDVPNYFLRVTAYDADGATIAYQNTPPIVLEEQAKDQSTDDIDFQELYDQAIQEGAVDGDSKTYEQFVVDQKSILPIFQNGIDEEAIDSNISTEEWLVGSNYGQAPIANDAVEDITLQLKASWNGFTMKAGDIFITNATSSKGITGHAAIANSDNYILDMPGSKTGDNKNNNRQLTMASWMSSYNSGWIRAYRLKDQNLAKKLAKYADRNLFSKYGTTQKTEKIDYAIDTHIYRKNPSYCSKFVFQAYYFGSGNIALMKPISGFMGPYGLIRTINWEYRPTEHKVYR